jgi:histidinol-phosphate aminotransferase
MANLVKLNTNENPYGPSPRALEALRMASTDQLRLYPEPGSDALRSTIARYYQLAPDQIFVGNGSDEVLAHAFHAFFQQSAPILFPDITYSFYPVYCQLYGIRYQTVALDANFLVEPEDFFQPNGGIIFPNPNAPTGCWLTLSQIRALLERNTASVVIVDEAYVDFGAESASSLIQEFPQLLVVQTFSKSRALAGLRVGYAMGQASLIEALNRIKDSFNSYPIDRLASAGAIAAIEDDTYFQTTRRQVMDNRNQLTAAMQSMGFEVLPSAANFVFACHPTHQAIELSARLRAFGIVVRHFRAPERIANFLRISVGDERTTELLIQQLESLIAA